MLFLSGFRQRNLYGASYRVKKDITFEDLAQRCDHVVKAEQEVIQNQLIRNSVDFIVGAASFLDPHRIQIKQDCESKEHTADYVVIGVGTVPARPADIPFDGDSIIDSDGLLLLKQLPKSLTIVGAGVIGCEYACILATLGNSGRAGRETAATAGIRRQRNHRIAAISDAQHRHHAAAQ